VRELGLRSRRAAVRGGGPVSDFGTPGLMYQPLSAPDIAATKQLWMLEKRKLCGLSGSLCVARILSWCWRF
jgi:hypothetical protein